MTSKNRKNEVDGGNDLFPVAKGVLAARGDMYWEYLEEFDAACGRLLDTHRCEVVVDLTRVAFISSSYVGCLGNLVLKAARLGKRITLKVTLDTSWLFDIMGGQKIMEMEVV